MRGRAGVGGCSPQRSRSCAHSAALAILAQWPTLRTVVITAATVHVLRHRPAHTAATEPEPPGAGAGSVAAGAHLGGGRRPSLVARLDSDSPSPTLPSGSPVSEGLADLVVVLPRQSVRVVDVVGAADAFVGGFVAAYCRQLPLPVCMLWGHAGGSLSVAGAGAQTSYPDLTAILVFAMHGTRTMPRTTRHCRRLSDAPAARHRGVGRTF